MQYVGVDLIEIKRIEKVIRRWGQSFLTRIYTPSELEIYKNTPSLAARFAGKEAVMKALGAGIKDISWQDIEILSETSGKPAVTLQGKAERIAAKLAIGNISISLSHSKDYAIAFVIAESV